MFSWFKKKEDVEIKPTVHGNLDYVIRNSKEGEEIKGIENTKLALISVKKQSEQIAVSVEFERTHGSDIFTEVHRTLVDSAEEAVVFFTRFGINGELLWLGDHQKQFQRKESRHEQETKVIDIRPFNRTAHNSSMLS